MSREPPSPSSGPSEVYRRMPTEVVAVYETLLIQELLAFLAEGLLVAYETADSAAMFTRNMAPIDLIERVGECEGGQFVVRKLVAAKGRKSHVNSEV